MGQEQFSIGVVGAGLGATNIYRILRNSSMVKIQFMCDKDENAPLIAISKKKKIPIFTDIDEALEKNPNFDFLLDTTGSKAVASLLSEKFPVGSETKIIEGKMALLIFKLVEDQFGDEIGDDNSIEEQYLSFKIEKEDYAFPLIEVMEIIMDQEITPLPNVSPYLLGVLNLRGEVIPVFSLRKMFHKEEAEVIIEGETNKNCIIILMINEKKYGVRVDTVNEVVNIPKDKIFPAPEAPDREGGPEHVVHIEGVGKVTEEQVVVIVGIDSVVGNIAVGA